MATKQDDIETPDIDGDFPPRRCKQLTGHADAIRDLAEAAERMPHAWLLAGPRGVGKASFAYLAARALFDNAPLDSLATAEDTANSHLVESEAHPDLFVLRRRFNHGTGKFQSLIPVDAVRAMKESFSMTAAMGGWRVCVLDSIDEMNPNGINALLKILEEPPPSSLFLIVCHNLGFVPDTIRSRCRVLHFSHLSAPELDDVLTGLYPTREAATRAVTAQLAEGSAGMAIRLMAHDGETVYRDMVKVLSAARPDIEAVHGLAERFSNRAEDSEKFMLFSFLLRGWLYRLIRGMSRGEAVQPIFNGESVPQNLSLDPLIDLWEKIGADSATIEEYNLDRKSSVLGWLETAGDTLGTALIHGR